MADWIDEKANYPRPQSRIHEMDGHSPPHEMDGPSPPQEMLDPGVPPNKPLPWMLDQRRSSPGLHHPIRSEHDRDSLWERRRGTPTSHHCRSSVNPCRGDRPVVAVTENATSSSSWRQSRLDGTLCSVPIHGKETPSSNTSTTQVDPNDFYQSKTNVYPMSHGVSPYDSAPTKDYPNANAVPPCSPNAALTPRTPNLLSPVSPVEAYTHGPLNIASSAALSHDDSSPATVEHQRRSTGSRTSLTPSPSKSMPEEPNDTLTPLDSDESYFEHLWSVFDSKESTAPIAPQIENDVLQLPRPLIQPQYNSQELDAPSVSPQQWNLTEYLSDSDFFNQPDGFDKVPEAEISSSMIQPVMTQFDTPKSEGPDFLSIASPPAPPSWDSRMELDSQLGNYFHIPSEPTQPATAFHTLPFPRFSISQTGIVTDPVLQGTMTGEIDTSAMSGQNMEQSDAGQSPCSSGVQPWSPFDHLIAISGYDFHSNGPQRHSNDCCPQAVPHHDNRHLGNGQAPSVKWLPHCFEHNCLLAKRSAPKQEHVEGLQDLIRTINTEWLQRLESLPGLWPLCSLLSASCLFERAVRTLRDFLSGSCAMKFEDTFALIHLAFAAAFSMNWQQSFYRFSAFCDDALEWQHALSSVEDKARFLYAMDCWRLHELEPTPLFTRRCHTSFGTIAPQETLSYEDQQIRLDRLRNGEVMKACISFLDSKSIRS